MPSLDAQKQNASLKTIGIEVTVKSTVGLSTQVENSQLMLIQASKDENGLYNISNLPLNQQKNGDVFVGEEKILSWKYTENNDLILEIFCAEQVNLWDELNLNNLFVQSNGPLLMGNKINCEQSIIMKAQALAFQEEVKCNKMLMAEADNGLVFKAPTSCNQCLIRSSTIYQQDKFEAKAQADFTTILYSSNGGSKLQSPTLRLVAEEANIAGEMNITDKCFLLANRITLGSSEQKSNINLAGDLHIKSDSLYGEGETVIFLNAKDQDSEILVKNFLNLHSGVDLTVERASFHSDFIKLDGKLNCNQAQLSINDIVNTGCLNFQEGNLAINEAYTSQEGGVLKIDNSHALIQEQNCTKGDITYNQSTVVGKRHYLDSGVANITGKSSLCLTEELQTTLKSSLNLDKSEIEAGKRIMIRGVFNLNQSKMDAPQLTCSSEQIKWQDYTISSTKWVTLAGKFDLTKGAFDVEILSLKGKIKLDETKVNSKYLDIKTDEGTFNKFSVQTTYFDISGGKTPEAVNFTNSVMTTSNFASKNHLTFEVTSLFLVGNENNAQSIGEGLVLNKSRFVSKKPILQAKNSTLSLQNHSTLLTPNLIAEGDISSELSLIFAQRLTQLQGSLTAKNTNLYVKDEVYAIQSEVTLQDNSKCLVPKINFLNNTQAKLNQGSALLVKESVDHDASSRLDVTDSLLMTDKIMALGSVKLDHSLLSAQDLRIYKQFDVVNQSRLCVEELITAAKDSIIRVQDSALQTKSMETEGKTSVSAGLIKVDEKLAVKNEGSLVLEPGAMIMAENLAVLGQMQVAQKEIPAVSEPSLVPAQLRVNNQFTIASQAKLEGNAPLVAEIHELSNFGTINLSNNLVLKGGLLNNKGHMQADSIYLGFDDAVMNTGVMSARELTIHSNFVNTLGSVYVEEAMNVSGLFGLNLGLISANNYNNYNLLSLNAGLVLPNLSADPAYIFSSSNLLSSARAALTSFIPGYVNIFNFASALPGSLQAVSSLYDLYENSNLEGLKSKRRHEWMPYIGQFQSLFTLGFNTMTTGYHAGIEFKNLSAKGILSGFSVPKWTGLGVKTAAMFAGSYRDASLVHLNSGLSLAANTNHSSLVHANTGVETSYLTHAINTHWLYNDGVSAGTESVFTAADINNKGTLSGTTSLYISTDTLSNKEQGKILGHNATVKAHSLEQSGVIDLEDGALSADHLENNGKTTLNKMSLEIKQLNQHNDLTLDSCGGNVQQLTDTQEANTKITGSVLKGDNASLKGHVDASNSTLTYDTAFTLEKTADMHTDNVRITTKSFHDAGKLSYEHVLEINAEKAEIEVGAVLIGDKTSEDLLFQEKKEDKPSSEASKPEGEKSNPTEKTEQTDKTDQTEKTEQTEKSSQAEKTDQTEKSTQAEKTDQTDQSTQTEKTDQATAETKEPQKEFKPQHILSLNTQELIVDGKLSGGDYTQINGQAIEKPETTKEPDATPQINKCKSIQIGSNAEIDLKYGSVASESLTVDGNLNLNNFDLKLDHTNISQNGHLGCTQTKIEGIDLVNKGGLELKDAAVVMSADILLEKNAHEKLENVSLSANKFVDHSQMSTSGQVAILTEHYEHDGKINAIKSDQEKADPNLFYVKSKTANLTGEAALDSGIYSIQEFDEAEAFLKGDKQYSQYQFTTSVGVEADRYINLKGKVNRDCGLMAKGKSVSVDLDYTTKNDLTFISTQGDVQFNGGQLNAGNVYAKSAAGVFNRGTINADAVINLEAEREFTNFGTLNGNQVAVKSNSIFNGHIINGRSQLFLKATGGNIENHGGMIRGGEYAQLEATGDVLNLCTVGQHWNGYDTVYDFNSGLIAGGTGKNTDNIGLYIKAGGKVYSDASDFVSDGVNYIEGDKGLYFDARQQTYIANQWTSKKWYGKKENHTEYSTQVRGSTVHSGSGVNILRTEHGGVESVATLFASPGGTQIYSRDDVNLYNIKTVNFTRDSKSSLFGLNKSTHTEYHEQVTPTLFVDNGVTRIVSSEGSVDARGALFVGNGDLEMEAKHRIKFGCDVLNHEINDETRSIGISAPGLQAYNAAKNGGNWLDVATAEDASIAKMNKLAHSENTAELVANASNLGIDLFNTSSSVMRGLANENLSSEMMARYGLGGAQGFSPNITISMTETKTNSKFQTLGEGGVDRGGNIKLKAGDGIDLENGVRVHAGGNIDIDAPELTQHAAALHSTFDQKTRTESLNITMSGQIQGAAYSQSKTHAEATNHVNAELSANGNIRLHNGDGAMSSVVLDGGNISCKTLDADIDHLTIISKQDTSSSKTSSLGLNTNGQVSFYKGDSNSRITNSHSGIHVTDGINNNGHSVHVKDAYMEGGKITSKGENNIVIDHLTSVELHDEAHTSGFGISLNLNDLGRMTERQKSTNEVGEQAIAVAELTIDHVNYQATQTAVIHGEQGTNISIGQLEGNLHTDSADGRTVIKNEEMHLVIDVPITNASYLESASHNFKAGSEKIHEYFDKLIHDEKEQASIVEEIRVEEIDQEDINPEVESVEDAEDDNNQDTAMEKVDEIKIEEIEELPSELVPIEMTKEMEEKVNEYFDNLNKDPEVIKSVDKIQKCAKAHEKKPSKKTKADLDKAIKHSITVIMKQVTEDRMGAYLGLFDHKFADHIHKIVSSAVGSNNTIAKFHVGRIGLLVGFAFNCVTAYMDGKEDVVTEGLSQSGADLFVGLVITRVATAGLTGGISWSFVGLEVFDALFYDEKLVDKMLESSKDARNDSRKLWQEGRYFSSMSMHQLAKDQSMAAISTQAVHTFAQTGSALKWAWDNRPFFNSNQPTQPKTEYANKFIYDSNRFFNPKTYSLDDEQSQEENQTMRNT